MLCTKGYWIDTLDTFLRVEIQFCTYLFFILINKTKILSPQKLSCNNLLYIFIFFLRTQLYLNLYENQHIYFVQTSLFL